ncbi:HAMP domain-containing protein [Streptomyces tsukubensis]|nr:HAMP domain-containing protein [Streptomyces tsukubensis]
MVLAALGAWSLSYSQSVNNQLINQRSPAQVEAVRLQTALLNQETGIRGYGLSGARAFLAPYQEGVAQQASAERGLRTLTRGDSRSVKDFARVESLAGVWRRTFADPVLSAPAGSTSKVANERAESGRVSFDRLRSALTEQQQHLSAEREDTKSALFQARTLRNVAFTLIVTTIIAMAVLVLAGLRRGVTDPLGRLSGQVRAVAEGDFDRPIAAAGPADLRSLSADVEGMRRRLVDELQATGEARAALHAQTTELRRSNEELEQFAYVASHDLQEPLRKVASFCQLLQRRYASELDDRANQYIEFAVGGANRMQTLINDLLAFSRVGRMHKKWATVDLERVWAAVVDSLGCMIEEKEAEVVHDPLPTVAGDATQLGMLFQNLLGNAVKFHAPDRPPVVGLSVRSAEGLWHFAVADNGIGIDPSFADRIFVIFQRLHSRDAYPGNGIGLALCKKIIEYHGGTITLDPDHTPGARFTFTLPVVEGREITAEAGEPGGQPVGPRSD